MALTSVFVRFYPDYDVSISTLANRISQLAGRNVSRVDDITGETNHYCIVHFEQDMPEILWNMLSAGQETIETDQGPICIGVNQSDGLDPKDDIMQFVLNDDGLYYREFKTGVVRKWNAELMNWFDTTKNPFVSEIATI